MGTRVHQGNSQFDNTTAGLLILVVAVLFGLAAWLCQTAVEKPSVVAVVTLYTICGLLLMSALGVIFLQRNKRTQN
jgi:hypothetical protein